jgi:hypothetical protein
VHSARTAPRPGNPTLASTHASGTPSTTDSPAAVNDVRTLSHSAVRTSGSPSTSITRPHGARHNSPANGSAKKSTAIVASTTTGHGGTGRRDMVVDDSQVLTMVHHAGAGGRLVA